MNTNELYRELFASSPDGILLLDAETQRAIEFNDAACRQLGYTREEFGALRIADYEASEAPEAVDAHIQTALREGLTEFDTRQRTKTGEIREVHVWTRAVEVDGRRAFHAIFRDVTEQMRARQALQDSERLLTESQSIAGLGSYVTDFRTGRWTSSAVLDEIFGIDDQFDRTVDGWATLVHPDWRTRMTRYLGDEVLAQHRRFDMEYQILRPRDGRARWVHGLGALEFDARDQPVRLIGTIMDITARKQADEALRRRDGILSAVGLAAEHFLNVHDWLETIGSVLARLGEATAVSRVVIFENRPGPGDEILISRRHEWRAAGVDARPDSGLTDLPLRAMGFDRWREVLSAGQGIFAHVRELPAVEQQALVAQGILSVAVVPIVIEGRWWGFIGFDACATERAWDKLESEALFTAARILGAAMAHSRLEEQFRQSQKMESVGQLASGIAHDFNNLLTVINGTADLLLTQVREDDPLRPDVREILRAGERAAALTRQLLAFSRQQILAPRVLNLNTVVAGMESLLRRLLGEDIDLVVAPAPDLGHVKADPGQIEQVIGNLAVNARDAMPQGGRLTIETQNVTIDGTSARQYGEDVQPGSYVRLAVSDSGIGMDAATRARIFEPFFTTKDAGKGTGLGLSTVYGIVTQSQGFISVSSEVGRGTSFNIYLPQVIEEVLTARSGPTAGSTSGGETVLLAEDNDALRKLAARLLEAAGYTVIAAATGEEALRVLANHEAPVNLLLSDVVMPGMSGRALAEQLAQTRPEMKVIYMSGYTDDTVVRHDVSDAQAPFLNKPFTQAALLRKVRGVLDS